MLNRIPRFVCDESLPAYAYLPGQYPHPTRDPRGHSFDRKREKCICPDPDQWHSCRQYLVGIDLFNHGYYWEAHEAWEDIWRECRGMEPAQSFFQALIRLAAAGLKIRQGKPRGGQRHAQGATELFKQAASNLEALDTRYMGFYLRELISIAQSVADHSVPHVGESTTPVARVFRFLLCPQ
jgi:predicted metal-dependent hydrolase